MPIHPPSIHAAPHRSATNPSPARSAHPHLRTHATRAAVVATTSAAAALLALLPVAPAGPAVTPVALAQAAPATAPALAVDSAALLATAVPVVPAAAPAPVTSARIAQVAVSTPVVPAHPPAAAPASSARASAVTLALTKVGSPYRWGATGPSSFDCSGLVNWAFEQVGIDVPRTSRALSQSGTPVSRADLQPGDLVFFYSPVSHVGIYIGDGRMVHASTSGKPVAVSSIEGREFNSARRY